ncbi:unnamed protein product, partial [Allacma fusca]
DRNLNVPLNNALHDDDNQNMEDTLASSQEETISDPETNSVSSSSLSKLDKTLLINAYTIKHGLTVDAVEDLLTLLQLLCENDIDIPRSNYLLKKTLNTDKSMCKRQFYCPVCKGLLGDQSSRAILSTCQGCNQDFTFVSLQTAASFFITFDVRFMIETLLKAKEVASNLHQNLIKRNGCRADSNIHDICDGGFYKLLGISRLDFTCSINTDGVSPYRSSKLSFWPVLISINELDYKLRRQHTILVALWSGNEKPNFDTFFQPLVTMFNELSEVGIQWSYNDENVSSKCYFPLFIADSVARCTVQGLNQFNGKYGCPWCLIKGQSHWMDDNQLRRKWIYKYEECILRTQDQFLQNLETLSTKLSLSDFKEESYKGVKSASQLLLLNRFDIVDGFVYDVMHSSYLGVVKMLTSFWFDSSYHDKVFYLGRRVQLVDKKLTNCRVPFNYDRKIRSIVHRKFWKATEWRTWAFIATTVLNGILPEVYRTHLLKMSNCLMILSDEKITPEDIHFCETNLSLFVQQAEALYGVETCTFNLHILRHAPSCVSKWGPLWGYSAFQFENFNGVLSNLFHGSRKITTQIMTKTLQLVTLFTTSDEVFESELAAEFFESMMQSKQFAKECRKVMGDATFVGPFQKYSFSQNDQRILKDFGIFASIGCNFRKCIIKGKMYCRADQITGKRNNSIVATVDNKIWLIQKLVYINFAGGTGVAVVQRIHGTPNIGNSYLTTVTRIDDAWSIVKLTSISQQRFITIYDDELKYLIRIPNTVELE